MAVPCKRRPLTARQKRRGAARGSRWVTWSCRSGRRTSGRKGPGGPSRGGEGKAEGRHPAGKPVLVGLAREVLVDMGRIPSGECSVQGDSEGPVAVMRA